LNRFAVVMNLDELAPVGGWLDLQIGKKSRRGT